MNVHGMFVELPITNITMWFRLDNYHVAFGHVTDESMDVLKMIETYGTIEGHGTQEGRTLADVRIAQCGQLN